jgi:hypothetical protein
MNSRQRAKEYLELKDSEYSIASSISTAVVKTGGIIAKPIKGLMKRRATKFAQKKIAGGAAGVIAAKTGVDKESIKGLIDGAGQMTGLTKGIRNEFTGKSSMLSRGIYKNRERLSGLGMRANQGFRDARERVSGWMTSTAEVK